jgi:hypothetical protein
MKRLNQEVKQIRSKHPSLQPDNAFVLWFVDAYLAGDGHNAFESIIGGKNDKTVDAVYVDQRNRMIHLVQCKYYQAYANHDLYLDEFAKRAGDFRDANFGEELKGAGAGAKKKLQEVHRLLHGAGNDYKLKLYFVTTAGITSKREKIAKKLVARSPNTELEVLDRVRVLTLLENWLVGCSLPLPELEIAVHGKDTLNHQNGHNGLDGWIFTTTSHEVKSLFEKAEERLFARNVRGYLGIDVSKINKAIEKTATRQPELFWFLNNGITIIADKVEKRDSGGKVRMHMWNPQVVNGQQTVRTLSGAVPNSSTVLVRLIRLAKPEAELGITGVVGQVVSATNRQNPIKQADLMANDAEQVRIEREFRSRKYAFARKKQDPKEFNQKAYLSIKVKREDLANALSATLLGAHTVRQTEQWDQHYATLFNKKRSMSDYLARWWAAKQISSTGSVLVEARWVVLDCLWSWPKLPLSQILNSDMRRRAFIEACESKDNTVLRQLHLASKQLFVAAKPVYLKERKEHAQRAKDSTKPFSVLTPDAFFRQKAVTKTVMNAACRDPGRGQKIVYALKAFQAKLSADS